MPSLPVITGKKAVKVFNKLGFSVVRIQGSHHIMKKKGHRCLLTVPVHSGKTLKPGTLRGLIRAAEVSPEHFLQVLNQI